MRTREEISFAGIKDGNCGKMLSKFSIFALNLRPNVSGRRMHINICVRCDVTVKQPQVFFVHFHMEFLCILCGVEHM